MQSFSGKLTILLLCLWGLVACNAGIQPLPPTPPPGPTATATAPRAGPLTLVWEGEFSRDSALGGPVDLAVDEQGNVFATSQSKLNIKKFDRNGKFVAQWGGFGTGLGQFRTATGISVDTQGNVYVADLDNNRIQKFDNNGKFLLQWPTDPLTGPASVGVDAQGFVYVNIFSTSDDHVQKFDSSGKRVGGWGPQGTGEGLFTGRTEDMTVDNLGNIYVSDPNNHRIQKFDGNGKFLAQFGGQASREGHGLFNEPISVAVDLDGNVYIVDQYFLQKFDHNGNFVTQWPTTKGGDLDRAGFIAVDKQGYLYILAHTKITPPTGGSKVDVVVVKKLSQP